MPHWASAATASARESPTHPCCASTSVDRSSLRDGEPAFNSYTVHHAQEGKVAMADFTPTQGRYLAFIHAYTNLHGYAPAETEIAAAICVSPPSVNQMVKVLEKKGLIDRQPGQPRSIQVRVPDDELPPWNARKQAKSPARPANQPSRAAAAPAAAPMSLYVVSVYLMSGPTSKKFANKVISRAIEIRGDQTLEELHHAIFKA